MYQVIPTADETVKERPVLFPSHPEGQFGNVVLKPLTWYFIRHLIIEYPQTPLLWPHFDVVKAI